MWTWNFRLVGYRLLKTGGNEKLPIESPLAAPLPGGGIVLRHISHPGAVAVRCRIAHTAQNKKSAMSFTWDQSVRKISSTDRTTRRRKTLAASDHCIYRRVPIRVCCVFSSERLPRVSAMLRGLIDKVQATEGTTKDSKNTKNVSTRTDVHYGCRVWTGYSCLASPLILFDRIDGYAAAFVCATRWDRESRVTASGSVLEHKDAKSLDPPYHDAKRSDTLAVNKANGTSPRQWPVVSD